jgi:hypothetical protein
MRWWHISLLVLVVINSVGLGLIYRRVNNLARQFPLAQLESSIKAQMEIAARLDGLQSLMAALPPAKTASTVLGMADLLPDKAIEATSSPITYVTVAKDYTSPVLVYKEQADFSAVLGQLIPDYKYPYYSKADNWYLVSLANDKAGWVQATHVSPVQ